jgi:hypothetical protein
MIVSLASQIAKKNDVFRKGGFGVMVTPGARESGYLQELLRAVREFNAFTEDNDPYGEHDFGSFERAGEKYFWKIDYYDSTLKYGELPLSPKCRRVLTIMLASEY